MYIEFVRRVETLATKGALRMAFETTLVLTAGLIVPYTFVLAELLRGKKCVFVGKNFLVAGTEVTVIY